MNKSENCPIEIVNLIKILIINYLIGFLLSAFYWDDFFKSHQSITSLLINQFLSIVFISWIFYKIYKGKNWARIIWLIAVVFGTLFIFSSTFNSSLTPTGSRIHLLFSTILDIYIFYTIFISPSRFWFSSNSDHPGDFLDNKSTSNSNLFLNNEKYWADALEEFEGLNRKPGLYAQCFAHANGDENITKAEYLKRRVSELIDSEKTFASNINEERLNEKNSNYIQENSLTDALYKLYFFFKTPIYAVSLIIAALGLISLLTKK